MLLQACHYNLTISRIYHSLFYNNFQTKLPPCLFPSSPPISLLLILQDDTTSAMATDNLSSGTQGSSRQCWAGAWQQHERGPSPSIPCLKVVPQTTTGPLFSLSLPSLRKKARGPTSAWPRSIGARPPALEREEWLQCTSAGPTLGGQGANHEAKRKRAGAVGTSAVRRH